VLKMEPLENDHHDYHHEGPAMHGLLHAHEPEQQKHRSSDHSVHRRSHHETIQHGITHHEELQRDISAHHERHLTQHEPAIYFDS